ncbi:MAG: hypothetical protein QW468_05590 [Candidatus Bathyarchaeia archaeon]
MGKQTCLASYRLGGSHFQTFDVKNSLFGDSSKVGITYFLMCHQNSPEGIMRTPYTKASTKLTSFSPFEKGYVAPMLSWSLLSRIAASGFENSQAGDLDDLLDFINSPVGESANIIKAEKVSKEEEVEWLSDS